MRTEFLRGQACLFHFHILSFRLLLLRTTPPTSWLSPSLPPSASVVLSLPCSDAFLISAAEWIPATLATLRGSAVISILIKQNRLVRDTTDQRQRLHSCVTTQRNICPKKHRQDACRRGRAEGGEQTLTNRDGGKCSITLSKDTLTYNKNSEHYSWVKSAKHGQQCSGMLLLKHTAIFAKLLIKKVTKHDIWKVMC